MDEQLLQPALWQAPLAVPEEQPQMPLQKVLRVQVLPLTLVDQKSPMQEELEGLSVRQALSSAHVSPAADPATCCPGAHVSAGHPWEPETRVFVLMIAQQQAYDFVAPEHHDVVVVAFRPSSFCN